MQHRTYTSHQQGQHPAHRCPFQFFPWILSDFGELFVWKIFFLIFAPEITQYISELTQQILTSDISDLANKGPMAEMIVGLELLHYRTPNIRHELYYWQRMAKNSRAEIDYVSSYRQTVLPIEVKAGMQGGMKSLWLFMREKNLTNAIRCSLENFGTFDYEDQEAGGTLRHVLICPLFAISRMEWLMAGSTHFFHASV